MSASKNPYLQSQIEETKKKVREATANLKPHPFGHAFLWGDVTTRYKNGKEKRFTTVLCSVCAEDLGEAVRRAESVPGVSGVWYNLD